MRYIAITGLILFGAMNTTHAFNWQDLWHTKDQQAQILMNMNKTVLAKDIFEHNDWRATAAYRAKDYKLAAELYASSNNQDSGYNQGNSLAQMGLYQQAIAAYDKALAINPKHKDALYNRKLLEKLLKQQSQQKNDDKNQQNQKSPQNQNSKKNLKSNPKQDSKENLESKPKQKAAPKNSQQEQDTKQSPGQDTKQDPNLKPNKDADNNQDAKQKQEKSDPVKPVADSKIKPAAQQNTEQWLQLIPDDPSGLMREKFMRDHLRRLEGLEP